MKHAIQYLALLLIRAMIKVIGKLLFNIRVTGTSHFPTQGGGLIVANHVSYLDFILILCTVPKHVSFVMNADIYRKPVLRFFLEAARCVPIASRGGKNDLEVFNQIVSERINRGEFVVIFAEGTVTRTGQILEFKKGVEHISKLIQAPIIPIHFFNASGIPFSFKAGKTNMEKWRWHHWRRPILAQIGPPISAPNTAFYLRQRIKELESLNFQSFLQTSLELPELLLQALNKNNRSGWHMNGATLYYHQLISKMHSLDQSLAPVLADSSCVALIAPKSLETMAIMVWLMMRRITIVPIPENLTNEEQLYAINKSKAEWLITTSDINFTKSAPIADQLIFIEDLVSAQKKGRPVTAMYRRARQLQQTLRSFFRSTPERNELACVLFEKKSHNELVCTALSYQNILAVIMGIRQVYFFEKSAVQLSDISHVHAHGIVMELLMPLLFDVDLHLARTEDSETELLEQLSDCEPSLVIATPHQLQQLAGLAARQNLPFITHIFTANMTPQHEAIRALRNRNIHVFVCAGLNQTSSLFAINLNDYVGLDIVGKPMEQENQNEQSIGKALPGVSVKITDSNGAEAPANEFGQLWIKGAGVSTMHHTSSECQMQLADGWLNSGWIASIDAQGFIFLHAHHS